MRGSVYFQATQLIKSIFKDGAKKEQRGDSSHENFQMVSSYKTMESYRRVWENLFNYLKEHWKLKDMQQIESFHIEAYMNYKAEYYPSKQYMEKISAAIGKLEVALKRFASLHSNTSMQYNFSIRQTLLDNFRSNNQVVDNYHNRSYVNPRAIIEKLKDEVHPIGRASVRERG